MSDAQTLRAAMLADKAMDKIEEQQAEIERLTALTEADAKEIGSYRKGAGLRGENRTLRAEVRRLQVELTESGNRISELKVLNDDHEKDH